MRAELLPRGGWSGLKPPALAIFADAHRTAGPTHPLEMGTCKGFGLAELLLWVRQDADHGAASPASHRGYKGFSLGRTTVPALALHLETQLRARVQTQPQNQIPGGQD